MLRDVKIRASQLEPKPRYNEIRRDQEVGREGRQNISKTAVEATAPWFGVYEVSLWWFCEVVIVAMWLWLFTHSLSLLSWLF